MLKKKKMNLIVQVFLKLLTPKYEPTWVKKKLFLIRSEILELPVKTVTANYEYSRSNIESLPLPIQIKIFKKPWHFFFIFFYVGIYFKLQCSEKNDTHRSIICEVNNSKKCAYLNGWQDFFLKLLWHWMS